MSAPFNMIPQPPDQSEKEKDALQLFWTEKKFEIENAGDFKSQPHLPLARIKRNMKANEDVKVVTKEAPVVIAKACELFIEELALRSWMVTEENKRHTIRPSDIARAVEKDDNHTYDFLNPVVAIDHDHNCPLHHPQDAMGRNKQLPDQHHMMPPMGPICIPMSKHQMEGWHSGNCIFFHISFSSRFYDSVVWENCYA
ncbi:nuclear transcription factor Y subunit C-2 [Senna tora]|uniref:Nuclear transcription factor Y subunit C-2 n=1 Tax=Senna tora TaxID=362788 RepID=A0A834SVK4_9FABA|nr:nuclear transcription factor Y subunit C-2 [Senna tora]